MSLVISNSLDCHTCAWIGVILPNSLNVELGAEVVDAVEDMGRDLDLGAISLVPELLIVVDESTFINGV